MSTAIGLGGGMVDVRPFRALRVDPARAHAVVAPPYDVMTTAEARTMVAGGRNQFLHVSRPEIDLAGGADPYADATYAQARTALESFTADGTLVREPAPVMYALRQTMGAFVQIGLVASASVDDYDATAIRIHEYTRADKELDRVRHVDAVDAHDEPVFLTYRSDPTLTAAMDAAMTREPIIDVVDEAGVWHELWTIDDEAVLATIVDAFAAIPVVYVADGHHRSAAASAVRKRRRGSEAAATSSETDSMVFADGLDGFLAVFVPTDRTHVMAYHRVVNDLGDMTHVDFLDEVEKVATVEPVDDAFAPTDQHTFGLFMGTQWYRCTFRSPPNDPNDPLQRLDVSMMQERVLAPILGITDPRTDPRLHFVGGIRGTHELERRVAQGAAAAFSLPATSVDDLLQVADRREVMPPKSTWFEPKLPSGLVVHPIS